MKKSNLMLVMLSMLIYNFYNSQTLWQDNFESYTVGNFTGNSDWVRDGGEDDWVKIENIDTEHGKSFKLNTPAENTSGIFVTHFNNWSNRNSNNDVFELVFDFYTGQLVTEGVGQIVIATQNFDEVVSIALASENNSIRIFSQNIDSALVSNPSPNTWYNISITYNSTTGEIRARVAGGSTIVGAGPIGLEPNIFDFTSIIESYFGIDNVTVSATSESSLGITELNENITNIYPNPVDNIINIQSVNKVICSKILDITGREISKYNEINKINISDLPTGNYMLKIFYENGLIDTHKISKK